MSDLEKKSKTSRTITYDITESDVAFRIVWYVTGSQPGVLLSSQSEEGQARFSGKIDGEDIIVDIDLTQEDKSLGITVYGEDADRVENYAESLQQFINMSLEKYKSMEPDQQARLRRALVAKICWDTVIYYVLKKRLLSDVYYQVAHGREMIIKATEGDEDMYPLTLSTSGWLSKIEKLPHDEVLPSDIASELAKKSVEWRRETHTIISQYLSLNI